MIPQRVRGLIPTMALRTHARAASGREIAGFRMIPRRRGQGGWAVVTFMLIVAIMLAIGLATLAIVDSQSRASGVERSRASAFTLAEGAMNGQAFMLSRAWPDSSAATCRA